MKSLKELLSSPEVQSTLSKLHKHKLAIAAVILFILAIELIPRALVPDADMQVSLQEKRHKKAGEIAKHCAKLLANSQGMERVYGEELMKNLEDIAFQSYYGYFLHATRQEQYDAFLTPSIPLLQQIMEEEKVTTVAEVLLSIPTYLYEFKDSKRKRYLQNAEVYGIEETISDTTILTLADLRKTPVDVYYSGRADCDDINGFAVIDFSLLSQECVVFSLEPGPGHEKYKEFTEGTYTMMHSILAVPVEHWELDVGVPWAYHDREYIVLDLTTLLSSDKKQIDFYEHLSEEERRAYSKSMLALFTFGDSEKPRYTIVDSRTVNNRGLLKTMDSN